MTVETTVVLFYTIAYFYPNSNPEPIISTNKEKRPKLVNSADLIHEVKCAFWGFFILYFKKCLLFTFQSHKNCPFCFPVGKPWLGCRWKVTLEIIGRSIAR